MLGRHVFMDSLVAHGVDRLFGNPGTTESPLIDALAEYPSIHYTVALHEGVALGAAAYYAQAARTTGVVNLHVAPGLGNAIGMLYCAMKANSPLIVTAGQQDTRMRLREPVLGHDLVAMAAPCVKWSVQAQSADELAHLLHRAFKIAHDPPAGPVFIALPINVMEQATDIAARAPGALYRAPAPDATAIAAIAALLGGARRPAIVAGDDIARAGAGGALMRVAERLGAPVHSEGLRGLAAVPGTHPNAAPDQLPVDAAAIRAVLADNDAVLLVGGPFFEEVWFADGEPFADGARIAQLETSAARLAHNHAVEIGAVGALDAALERLGDELGARGGDASAAQARNATLAEARAAARARHRARVERASARRPLAMPVAMALLAEYLPDDVVVVDETITASLDLARSFEFDAPDSFFSGRGGGIGQGLPGALGAQLALPQRTVACISGDGSAMYSIQALWTAAHHALPVLFIILANGEYRILKHNLDSYRQRFGTGSNQPYAHMDLAAPALGFVELAAGLGVAGERVSEPDALRAAIDAAIAARAPRLIELVIEGKR